MMRAPMSASIIEQYGPDITRLRSSTVMPASGARGMATDDNLAPGANYSHPYRARAERA